MHEPDRLLGRRHAGRGRELGRRHRHRRRPVAGALGRQCLHDRARAGQRAVQRAERRCVRQPDRVLRRRRLGLRAVVERLEMVAGPVRQPDVAKSAQPSRVHERHQLFRGGRLRVECAERYLDRALERVHVVEGPEPHPEWLVRRRAHRCLVLRPDLLCRGRVLRRGQRLADVDRALERQLLDGDLEPDTPGRGDRAADGRGVPERDQLQRRRPRTVADRRQGARRALERPRLVDRADPAP